jgi:hypothetical protein
MCKMSGADTVLAIRWWLNDSSHILSRGWWKGIKTDIDELFSQAVPITKHEDFSLEAVRSHCMSMTH